MDSREKRKNIDSDKEIVYKMGTESHVHMIMSASDIKNVFEFGELTGIINTHNYGTVINRLRMSLESLWLEGKCVKHKEGRGYSYDFSNQI